MKIDLNKLVDETAQEEHVNTGFDKVFALTCLQKYQELEQSMSKKTKEKRKILKSKDFISLYQNLSYFGEHNQELGGRKAYNIILGLQRNKEKHQSLEMKEPSSEWVGFHKAFNFILKELHIEFFEK